MRVLVIEDNRRLADALCAGLSDEGYTADVAHDGISGLELATAGDYDALVLDLLLPRLDGLGVLARLREAGSRVPVLILTARDEVDDRVAGLDAGADDYLVKPFAFEELLARLRAIIRRRDGSPSNMLVIGDLEVDTAARSVSRAGRSVQLSAGEYRVLEVLARRRGRTVSRDELLAALYEPDDEPSSNVVEVYIGQLRRKLDRDHPQKLIRTRRGLGYVLGDDS